MNSEYKLTLPAKTVEDAAPGAKEVLESAQKKLGFVPKMYERMANSPGLLQTYIEGYESFRAQSGFTPVEQEVIFLTISRANGCDYCVAAHSFIADQMSKVPAEITNAIREGRPLPDTRLAALSKFTDIMLTQRGLPSQEQVRAFLDAGYAEQHILGIILAISVKTISNYSNHLFHTPVDDMFAGHIWQAAE